MSARAQRAQVTITLRVPLVRVGRPRARRRPFADVMNRTYWLHVLLTDCAVRPCRVSVDSTPTQLLASTGLDETSGREAELLKR